MASVGRNWEKVKTPQLQSVPFIEAAALGVGTRLA
jgi:hypothetical protein